jgi:hypothetical protein
MNTRDESMMKKRWHTDTRKLGDHLLVLFGLLLDITNLLSDRLERILVVRILDLELWKMLDMAKFGSISRVYLAVSLRTAVAATWSRFRVLILYNGWRFPLVVAWSQEERG